MTNKDKLQPPQSLKDQLQVNFDQIKEQLGYQESGHAWQQVTHLGKTIEEVYNQRGGDPQVDTEVIDALTSLQAGGGKLSNIGEEIFRHKILPWFLRKLSKAKGLNSDQEVEQLQSRVRVFINTLLTRSEDINRDLENIDPMPTSELVKFLNESESLYRLVLELILSLDRGNDPIGFSDTSLSSQKEKELYSIIYESLINTSLTSTTSERLHKIKELQSRGSYVYPFHLGNFIAENMGDKPEAIKQIWEIFSD